MTSVLLPGGGNGDAVIPSTKRISYILPPLQDPPPLLRLPTLEENLSSIHGRVGPLVYPAESSTSRLNTANVSRRKESSSRGSHPRHTLPVSSLAIDTSTVVEGSKGSTPTGILYTGGRDGMVAAWELGLRMKRRNRVNKYSLAEEEKGDYDRSDINEDEDVADTAELLDDLSVSKSNRTHHYDSQQYDSGFEIDTIDDHLIGPASFRQCLGSHTDWINDIVLCNENQTVISASSDRTVKIWNPHDPKTSLVPQNLGTHKDYVRALALASGPNWIASGSFDRTIKLWDLKEMRGDPIMTISEPHLRHSVYNMAVDHRGSILAAATPEKTIILLDPRTGLQVSQLVGHTDNVRSLVMSKDGSHLLSASSDSTIRLWSIAEQRCLHTFTHHNDSVWSLYSNHDSLDIFYSGDRSGVVCKVDWERCNEVSEGECVVLAKERSKDNEGKFDRGSVQDEKSSGIYRIIAADNAYFWTASSNSCVSRWKDVLPRSEREALYPISSRSYEARADTARSNSRREFSPLAASGFSPIRPSALRNESSTNAVPGSVSFADRLIDNEGRDSETAGLLPHAEDKGQQTATLYGLPFDSLVCLALPDDPYGEAIGLGSISFRAGADRKSTATEQHLSTVYSTASLISIPTVLKTAATTRGDSFSFSPTGLDVSGSPTSKGLLPINAHLANIQHNQHHHQYPSSNARPSSTRSASIRFAPLQSRHSYSIDEGQGSFRGGIDDIDDEEDVEDGIDDTVLKARHAYEERDSAVDALPLRTRPEDVIIGSHGLIRSCMLNDRRHVLAIDSSGSTILWDIATSQCLGAFEWKQVKQAWVESQGSNKPLEGHLLPGDALDLIKERIQGEAATAMWCTVDTKIGSLSVHLEDSRCFDAEIYLDELNIIDSTFKEDQRISLAKLVLRNLFDGFIKQEARLRSVGKAGEEPRLKHDTLALERSQDFLFSTKPNLKLDFEQSQFDLDDDPMSTPGMTIALAVPAKTPAVLSMANPMTPKPISEMPGLQQMLESDRQAGIVTSTNVGESTNLSDYFSLQSNASVSNSKVSTPQAKMPLQSPSSPGLMGRLRMSLKREQSKKEDKNGINFRSSTLNTTNSSNNVNANTQLSSQAALKISKQQLDAIRQIIKNADPIKVLEEVPSFGFPPQTAIMISESLYESASFHVNYRGLVQSTGKDISTLELACPHWLLEYLVGVTLAAPAFKEKDKLTFLLIPWDPQMSTSSQQNISAARMEKMPAMPTGNSRLTATRMLRIRKACAYVVDKLEIFNENNIEARSRANSIIASRRGSEAISTVNHNDILHSDHQENLKDGTRLHSPFSGTTNFTSDTIPIDNGPSQEIIGSDQDDIRADEIVEILCNGTLLPAHCTLAQIQRYYWKSSNVIKLEYRWKEY